MNRWSWICWLLLGTLWMLVSCGDSGEKDNTDTDGDGALAECTLDEECDTLQWCSRQGACVEFCRYDLDCPNHKACDSQSRQCVECTQDEHCTADGFYCDTDYKVCKIGCEDCAADQACVNDRCARVEEDGDEEQEEDQVVVVRCPPAPSGMACEPNCHECLNDETARQCRTDGSGFDLIPCLDGLYCDDSVGACSSLLCEPFTRTCIENTLRLCNDTGTAFEDVPCGEYEECRTNACINRVCSGEGAQLFSLNHASVQASPSKGCDFALNVGTATFETLPDDNGVAVLSGIGHVLRLDSRAFNGTSDITLGVRFKLSGSSTREEVLITKGTPVVFELAVTAEGMLEGRLSLGGQVRTIPSDQAVTRETWHAALLSYDGHELALYVDGVLQAQPVAIQGAITQSVRPVFLGGAVTENGQTEREMVGMLDNVLLAQEAMGARECAYLFNELSPCEPIGSPAPDCPDLCTHERAIHPVATDWTQSEVNVSAFETVTLDPGGCAPSQSGDACLGPEGKLNEACQSCAMSGQPRYALLAKIGATGAMFLLPERQSLTPATTGNLFLGYNNNQFTSRPGALHTVVEYGYCPDTPCPNDMVPVPGMAVCIDRYEASCAQANAANSPCNNATDGAAISQPGIIPWTNLTPLTAQQSCEALGKRLCRPSEWQAACRGDGSSLYPYGDSFVIEACNDGNHQAVHPFGLEPTAYMGQCVSDVGATDLSGNAAEIVYDTEALTYGARGGNASDSGTAASCDAETTFISSDQALTVGFRCCKDWP